jgi:hypothetical protein
MRDSTLGSPGVKRFATLLLLLVLGSTRSNQSTRSFEERIDINKGSNRTPCRPSGRKVLAKGKKGPIILSTIKAIVYYGFQNNISVHANTLDYPKPKVYMLQNYCVTILL